MKKIILILIITFVLCIFIYGQDPEEQHGLPIYVQKAGLQSLDDIITAFGEVKPHEDVQLSSQFGGRITQLYVNEGDWVKQNQLVAAVRSKEAEILSAQTYSESNDIKIYSPVSGFCLERFTSSGDIVSAGQSLIRIVSTKKSYLAIRIPEKYINKVTPGCVVNFHNNGKDYTQKLSSVAPVIDSATGTFLSIAELDEKSLRPGMYIPVKILLKSKTVIAVPRSALLTIDGDQVVYVIEKKTALLRKVKTGIRTSNFIEVKEGINPGEVVAVIGNYELGDGIKVEVLTK